VTLLPEQWEQIYLGELAVLKTGPFGSTLHKSDYRIGGIPVVNPMHIIGGKIVPSSAATIAPETAERLSEFRLQRGDVVLGRRGDMGRCAVVGEAEHGWLCGTGSLIIRPGTTLDPHYLQRFLSSPAVVSRLEEASVGSTMVNLNQRILLELEVPIPPLAEQKRIADKLDTVFARIDACCKHLDRVPAILNRFRQAVLTTATSGELTEEWRKQNGKETGRFALLATLGEVIAGQSPRAAEVNYEGRGEFYVTGPEQWDGRQILHRKWTEYPKRIAPDNSIFVTVKGAGVGKTFLGCRAAIGRDVYAFVPHAQHNRTYVLFSIQASVEDIIVKAKGLIPGLSKSDLTGHEIYLPTADEQDEIVRRVEALFAYTERLDARYTAARAQVERLTPALLAKAFRGELVPQDPNDEPASVLLERIRTARAALERIAGPKRRKGSSRPKISQKAEALMLTRIDIQDTHLTTILRERGPLTAEALWSASQLDIDDFYDQLKDEESRGLLREKRGDSSNAPRTLEAA